ncbi:hypothetical protein B296_00030212 [Ensete ventricosum]|uniref:Uncharacterized protein n=1 Tax=Ensete ventricosum TaxID=4639 RepID=A0A426X363_ENSVE|nr:hypothetical protein B296_00030212 [Ensete ventricosum]
MRSCNEPSGCSEDRLVFDQGERELIRSSDDIGHKSWDLAEEPISSTNPGDFTEGLISGTNLGDLAEEPISGRNPGDFAEGLILVTNPGDLAEEIDLGHKSWGFDREVGVFFEQVGITSSNFSSSVRVISSPGSRGVSQSAPEASSSGASSGPLSLVDSRALRDLEVMKADHDLDTVVTEGSLVVIRERYNIPAEYGLHVPQPGQRSFSSDVSDQMDLGELRGMPKVSRGKAPSTRTITPAQEVFTSPARETSKASSKRPIDTSTEQVDDPARRPKKVKVLTRRHKSRHGEGETRSCSKGKEPAAPLEELETPVEYDEGGASSVHHRPRSMNDLFKTKDHKDDAGYYTLHMSDLGVREGTSPPSADTGAIHAPLRSPAGLGYQRDGSSNFPTLVSASLVFILVGFLQLPLCAEPTLPDGLFDRVHDAGRLITFMDYRISNLQQEAVAKAKERASELEQELGKTKQERDEALQWLEASKKELTEVQSNLAEIQRLLKEAWVRAQKMDDELLQSVKALESARSELPK